MMVKVTGANVFGQWLLKEPILKEFQKVSNESSYSFDIENATIVHIGWSYNIFKVKNQYFISGTNTDSSKQISKVDLEEIRQDNADDYLVSGNDYNLILVNIKTHIILLVNLEDQGEVKKVKISDVPLSPEEAKAMRREDDIVKVVATNNSCLLLTAAGAVYVGLLPSYLDTSHCEGKVVDVQCGYEHYVLLTDTGKVYTWGKGWRLQLGHGDLLNLEVPQEVEALSGIKIDKISAGGWHTLALSEFGGLYAWGWNDTGQLGIKESTDTVKNMQSYAVPTLLDFVGENGEEITSNVIDMSCGTRHSVVLLEDNSVWASGSNKYGQLGLSPDEYSNINYFKKVFSTCSSTNLLCGPWSSALMRK